MSKHAPDLMEPTLFATKVGLSHKRVGWSLKHPIKPHPLNELHAKLCAYKSLHKAQLRSRHQLLDQIVRLSNNYTRGKKPNKTASEKVQTVAVLGWQANRRLTVEQARAKDLAARMGQAPNRGVDVHGHGGNLRYERLAKPGGIVMSGADLIAAARAGKLGAIELSPDLEPSDVNDFYAVKKLLKTLSGEQLRQAGLKQLEYASDTQREHYAVEVKNGRIVWQLTGERVDTQSHMAGEVPGMAHYACDLNGDFYVRNVAKSEMGRFAHSSFLAGETALCAGTVSIKEGRLLEITNESGHYTPRAANLADACDALLHAGYNPGTDGYALFVDFNFELLPPAGSGFYRVPMRHFAQTQGIPPDHAVYEVIRQATGMHQYVNLGAAQSAGCVQESLRNRVERKELGCMKGHGYCPGPKTRSLRTTKKARMCDFCSNYEQIARVKRLEAHRIRKIDALSRRNSISMGSAHGMMADYAEQVIVDMLFECGIDVGAPGAGCAFLTCGSLARGESATYSDIDAVLVVGDTTANPFYQGVMDRMNTLLQTSGIAQTGFKFCPGGLSPAWSSMNNDPLIGTPEEIFHLIDAFTAAYPGPDAVHLQGALHTKLVFGDRHIADRYEAVCAERRSGNVGQSKAHAMAEMREFTTKMRSGPWKIPDKRDLYIKIKDQLYRPAHMIVHALAQYYGLTETASRAQISKLVAKGKMSTQVAQLLVQILDDAGRLRTEVQLEQGQEFEVLKMRHRKKFDPSEDRQLVSQLDVASKPRKIVVGQSAERLKILLGLAEGFTATKSGGILDKKKSPFKSTNPGSYSVNV